MATHGEPRGFEGRSNLHSFTTYFNAAYCIMVIPSQVILTYIRPSFWLPGLEIIWGVLTGLIAMSTNAKQVYALRVFLGLCESSAWPGMMTLFSKKPPPFKSSLSANLSQCIGIPQPNLPNEWASITLARLSDK